MTVLTEVVYPDTGAAVRSWLDGHLDSIGITGVFRGVPAKPVWPLVTASRIGGQFDENAATDDALITLSAWAESEPAASSAIRRTLAVLANAGCGTRLLDPDGLEPGADLLGVEFRTGPLWRPDRQAGTARYLADLTVSVRAV